MDDGRFEVSTYDAIVTAVGYVLGGSAAACLLWAAVTDDGHNATGELDGFGVPVEPDDEADDLDDLARVVLRDRFADRRGTARQAVLHAVK